MQSTCAFCSGPGEQESAGHTPVLSAFEVFAVAAFIGQRRSNVGNI